MIIKLGYLVKNKNKSKILAFSRFYVQGTLYYFTLYQCVKSFMATTLWVCLSN